MLHFYYFSLVVLENKQSMLWHVIVIWPVEGVVVDYRVVNVLSQFVHVSRICQPVSPAGEERHRDVQTYESNTNKLTASLLHGAVISAMNKPESESAQLKTKLPRKKNMF